MVDDYHPPASTTEAKQLEDKAQKLLRTYGDRVARGRLTAATDFRPEYVPRGIALVTGEDLIGGQSSNARYLGVEISKDSVDLSLLSQAQSNGELLPQAMRGYIEWLSPQMPHIAEELSTTFLENRKAFQEDAAHGRIGEAAAWLQLGFDTMLEYMLSLRVISSEEASKFSANAQDVFFRLVRTQSAQVEEETPAERFLTALCDLLACGAIGQIPEARAETKGHLYHNSRDFVGWEDKTMYYFIPSSLYAAVEGHLNRRKSSLNMTERTLWAQLDELKVLVTDNSSDRSQRAPKKNIPGKNSRIRVLHIPKARVLAYNNAD